MTVSVRDSVGVVSCVFGQWAKTGVDSQLQFACQDAKVLSTTVSVVVRTVRLSGSKSAVLLRLQQ